jgi:membrane protein DedA with SNARE-associated domain
MGWFETFAHEYAAYGYPVLFAGVLLENAGIPVPGETAVLFAGFLASPAGGGHFHVLLVILTTLVAAVLGDNIGFWLGHRWARPRIQQGRGFLFLTPKMLQLAEGYFARYGTWTIFFARFITGLRVVGALAAGAAGMAWPRFLVANAGGALAWAVTMSLLGYFFGHSLHLIHKYIGWGGVIILSCLVVLIALPYLLRRLRRLAPGLWERMFRAQIWQGILAAILEVVCVALLVMAGERDHRIDRQVEEWLASAREEIPSVNALAEWGLGAGSLPVVLVGSGLLIAQLWYRQRSRREIVAMLWALFASEGVGLILLALLRHRGMEIGWTVLWPDGPASLAPLRALAAFGMAAYLLGRQNRLWGIVARSLAAALILVIGFCAVWIQVQTVTQVLLEYAAGGLILFGGLWWLEGFSGLLPIQSQSAPGSGVPAGVDRADR